MENTTPLSCCEIDGSQLEGGGQLIRISVSLACLLNKSIRLVKIRAGRPKPGLAPQHLAGLELACSISGGTLQNACISTTDLRFDPGHRLQSQYYSQSCGTAGSITLMMQVSLPCVVFQNKRSPVKYVEIDYFGGTNVSSSPPYDHLQHVFLPLLEYFGVQANAKCPCRGYYPRGGGRATVQVAPVDKLTAINLTSQGKLLSVHGVVYGNVSPHELKQLQAALVQYIHDHPIVGKDGTSINTISIYSYADKKMNNTARYSAKEVFTMGIQVWIITSTGCRLSENITLQSNDNISTNSNNSITHNKSNETNSTTDASVGQSSQVDSSVSNGNISNNNNNDINTTNTISAGKPAAIFSASATENLVQTIVSRLQELVSSQACCDEFTADSLLIYMALAHGESSVLVEPENSESSLHILTAISVATTLTGAVFDIHTITGNCNSSISNSSNNSEDGSMAGGIDMSTLGCGISNDLPEGCRLIRCTGINFIA